MKKNFIFALAILTGLLSLNSCNQVEEKGQLSLGLEMMDENLQKSAATYEHLTTALITIMAEDGSLVMDKEPVELIKFGDAVMTRSLKLPVGGYILSEFMLTDSSGVALWATPKEGSVLENLVRNPLPRHFNIQPNETNSLSLQVIRVGSYTPEDFGYAQFNIDFVERFCLKVAYTQRCPSYEYDSLIGPDGSMMGPDGSMMPFYQGRIKVFLYDRLVLNEPMNPGENKYPLPMVNGRYVVVATGCDGTTIFKQDFSLRELGQFRCNPDYPYLQIPGNTDPDIVITPEGIYEPNIRQGLFGRFEPPLDYFMDSTLNTDNFFVRDLHIFPYHVMDSIYTFAPVDCYIHPDMVPEKPLVKLRSNSEGYFQVELKEGEYLYMVKTEEGYYIDAFVSSHKPGYVRIYPGEVTHLYISLMDCSMWM